MCPFSRKLAPRRPALLAVAGLIAVLLLAGPHPAAAAPQGLVSLGERPAAPALALPEDETNQVHRLSDLRGKVVLVNFWATWCPPCRKELPSMERLWRLLKGEGLVVLGVNVDESSDEIYAFTAGMETPPTFPLLRDEGARVAQAWPVKGLPTTYVVDNKGRIALGAVGGREFDSPAIVEQIRGLLREP
jgi:thiol-disulfide isomerase/thioredoxin